MVRPSTYARIAILQLFLVFQVVLSRPNGAPRSACTTLTPTHGEPLSGVSPFRFHIQSLGNRRLRVRLLSSNNQPFQGFILQAREVGSDEPLGSFIGVPTGTKAIRCRTSEDTATHQDTEAKFDLVFSWSAPDNFEGDIVFLATIAENYSYYWLRISSQQVTLSLRSRKERTIAPEFMTRKPASPTYTVPLPETGQPPATESPTYTVPDTEITTQQPTTTKRSETEQPSITEMTSQSPMTTQMPVVTEMMTQGENQSTTMEPTARTRAQGTTQDPSRIDEQSTVQPRLMISRGKTYSAALSINGEYDPELNNNQSQKFQTLAATLKMQIENVYKEANESVVVKVLRFSNFRPDNFIVELALTFDMKMSEPLHPLQEATKDGQLGNIAIIPYSIKLIGENICASNMCHKNATCIQTSDSFMCKCDSGFTGDGVHSCSVITPVAGKQENSKDDYFIKNLLIASLVIIGIILVVVIISLIILIIRILQNGKSEVNK